MTRELLEQALEALQIAKSFCGKLTADECDDSVAIPINEATAALVAHFAHPERSPLGSGELLQQALEAMEAFTDPEDRMPEDTGEFRDLKTVMFAIRAHLAKPDTSPAWKDAPDAPGLWCSSVWNARHFSLEDIANFTNYSKRPAFPRWFGPIPEDTP